MDINFLTSAINNLHDVQLVSGGMDASAITLSGNVDGEKVFIKIVPKVPPGVQFAKSLGHPNVLAPQTITELPDGRWVLLYSWIDGKNGFEAPLLPHHWVEVGRILRDVHASKSKDLDLETFTIDGLPEFVETKSSSPFQPLFEWHAPTLDRGLELVANLSEVCKGKQWDLVPCHADLHVGNIVVCDDKVFLVDWDTARLAPAECDYLFFEAPGILGKHTVIEELRFQEGYGEFESRELLMSYYRFARAFEDIVSFAREGNAEWLERQFGSGSMLELALKRVAY